MDISTVKSKILPIVFVENIPVKAFDKNKYLVKSEIIDWIFGVYE